MSWVHVPGTCCSDMAPLVNSFTCATPIWAYFVLVKCRRKFNLLNFMGHVAGTKRCNDGTKLRVYGWLYVSLLQNQKLSQSETTTRIICARAQRKQDSNHQQIFFLLFFMYLITELELCHLDLIAARFLGGCTFTNRANNGVIASLVFCPLAFFKLLVP